MNKKIMALLSILMAVLLPLSSEPIYFSGFTSVHNNFGWWLLAIIIAMVVGIIVIGVVEGCNGVMAVIFGVSGSLFAIAGFWFFPTVWCSLLGALLGAAFTFGSLGPISTDVYNGDYNETFILVWSIIIAVAEFVGFILIACFLPAEWCWWKFYALAGVGAILSWSSFGISALYEVLSEGIIKQSEEAKVKKQNKERIKQEKKIKEKSENQKRELESQQESEEKAEELKNEKNRLEDKIKEFSNFVLALGNSSDENFITNLNSLENFFLCNIESKERIFKYIEKGYMDKLVNQEEIIKSIFRQRKKQKDISNECQILMKNFLERFKRLKK